MERSFEAALVLDLDFLLVFYQHELGQCAFQCAETQSQELFYSYDVHIIYVFFILVYDFSLINLYLLSLILFSL